MENKIGSVYIQQQQGRRRRRRCPK
ncbi:trans-sialidase, putative [Trypanosoma cruzi marinkellei]|uniref:Trans-sialidase, putative n=1 Tax=Trypanosoma cruzi marinkellei TaxID=85056 RepID=K2MQ13_TRYCR|nr:trans-sialidase, putative [Trypanosoma cruzi marinkellei]